ncbi:4-hydroxybenzoate octaprenyltransferase [Aliidiomarina maris]|uniref:4-hydroxybenzoate octaprenyltransferase n=1 Tax=Aliidiomarina maris TaxID=531312 RepID=A0A327X2N7_9GAMM|nr:4-hydroxybenzoate octaprenyltransferase [Aliidiomarina maris]RAJ99153.1 4-hydroxybenzoate polyprenyltransferase [Aliidiomarina maris]RUO27697.1 4-hydroxybenzoate octaprenyltransferase [Aliidiomarina maris]
MSRLRHYRALMRMDKPIGTWLLAWPTFWALLVAGAGDPSIRLVAIFAAGVFLMRSAGCVINDFADRKLDRHVQRTRERPLASGKVTSAEALVLFVGLVLLAFLLVLTLNWLTVGLSAVALALAAAYPFAKRFTHLPQVILGAAFSMAIPMAFAAVEYRVPLIAWVLFAANLVWTVAYDTQYAMADREDDLKVGIKSSAILFGRYDLIAIALLQTLTIALLALVGWMMSAAPYYWISVALAAAMFVWQLWMISGREPDQCMRAFRQNHYVGMIIAIGIALHFWLPDVPWLGSLL